MVFRDLLPMVTINNNTVFIDQDRYQNTVIQDRRLQCRVFVGGQRG